MKPPARASINLGLSHALQCAVVIISMWAGISLLSSTAWATCPPDISPPPPLREVLKQPAQLLYDQGVHLLAHEPKDYIAALELFMQSRAVYPSPDNSLMAAMCLRQLGRYPEALALYNEILVRFDEKLEERERSTFQRYAQEIQAKVLIVYVREREGSFAIDEETCGPLPRALPVYLMPGPSHTLYVTRGGKPEPAMSFSGNAGATIELRLPQPPAPPPPPSPPKGHWFVQASGGPAIGADLESDTSVSLTTGFLIQTRDGYRFPNELSLALTMGMFYMKPEAIGRTVSNTGVHIDGGTGDDDTTMDFLRDRPTFAPYMGISAGWEPSLGSGRNALIRLGLGIMAAQSKNVVDVNQGHLRQSLDDARLPADGREIIKSVPPYASVDVGLVWNLQRIRLGISLGALFLLTSGPDLPEVNIVVQSGAIPNTVTLGASNSYRPSLLFVPQLVFGFDP